MNFHSKAVHAGDRKRKAGTPIPVTTPIHTAASFFYDSLESIDKVFAKEIEGYAYSRYDNPTNAALEELVSSLESAHGSLATASGMSALQIAITAALIDRRKHVLAANAIYGATVKLLQQVFEPFGTTNAFVDICDLDAVQKAIDTDKPGVILMESVSNPLLRIGQIDKIAEMARKVGACLIVDNTFATPYLQQPFKYAVDFVFHSTTKFLNGHGTAIGGVLLGKDLEFMKTKAWKWHALLGGNANPFDAYLLTQGIKTFELRMERHCSNAMRIANYLNDHEAVRFVNYLGLQSHPDFAIAHRQMKHPGAMMSFELKGGLEAGKRFIDKLQMCIRAVSLGTVDTLVCHPASMTHYGVAKAEREKFGITDGLIRLSVGIENIQDILADLEQALLD